mmetsp:Transcript_7534/g.21571  ORF Transcript_7534/g.21571 Transcript_7534/m.21571 type:complete len:293 (+) Transcript_7534:1066-1944(+)
MWRMAHDDAPNVLRVQLVRELFGVLPGHAVDVEPAAIHHARVLRGRCAVAYQVGASASRPGLHGVGRRWVLPLGLGDPRPDLVAGPFIQLRDPLADVILLPTVHGLRARRQVWHLAQADDVAGDLVELVADDLPVHEQGVPDDAREFPVLEVLAHAPALGDAVLIALDHLGVRHSGAFGALFDERELLTPELELAVAAHVVLEVVSQPDGLRVVFFHVCVGELLLGFVFLLVSLLQDVLPRRDPLRLMHPVGPGHRLREPVDFRLVELRSEPHLVDVSIAKEQVDPVRVALL